MYTISTMPPPQARSYSNVVSSGPLVNPSQGGPDPLSRITGKLASMTANSTQRQARLRNVRILFNAIIALNTEIRDAMGSGRAAPVSPEQLTTIENALTRLDEQLKETDVDNDELIKALLQNANDLVTIRETQTNGAVTPGITALKTAITAVGQQARAGGYKHSKTNSRKYMVKKFRSARVSSRRMNKKKRKTLRRSKR